MRALDSINFATLALVCIGAPQVAKAAYVVNVQQVGTNVVATGSGSLNTSILSGPSLFGGLGFVSASSGVMFLGGGPAGVYNGFSGPTAFGPGVVVAADSTSGDSVAIYGTAGLLVAPSGYTSGSALSTSTSIWNGQTLASLGMTPGTYSWAWSSRLASDSFTLQIVDTAVPEPSTWAMMLTGFCLAGAALRRRRAIKAIANFGAFRKHGT